MMNIVNKLTPIFRETFADESLEINEKSTADDIDAWDSLSHVNLILAIEIAFEIEFSQREIMSFQNVGDMVSCIEKKI